MRSIQTREEKIIGEIFSKIFNEKLSSEITDSPDLFFKTKWIEVTQITPQVVMKMPSVHENEKIPKNKSNKYSKVITSTPVIDDGKVIYNKYKKITKPKIKYDYSDWKQDVENLIQLKIENFDKYKDNTGTTKGYLVIYEKANLNLFWIPKDAKKEGNSLEKEFYGYEEARGTIDNSKINFNNRSDSVKKKLHIVFTSDFQNLLIKEKFFSKYKGLFFVEESISNCFVSEGRLVNIKETNLEFLNFTYYFSKGELKCTKPKEYSFHDKNNGTYMLKEVMRINGRFE